MKDTSELVGLERENFVACYRALAEAAPEGVVLDEVGSFAFATGLPLPMFNGCIVTDPDRASEPGAALTWLAGLNVPYTLWVPRPVSAGVEVLAAEHGLVPEPQPLPGMVLNPVPQSPALPRGLVIESVDSRRNADFAQVVVALGLGEEAAAQLTSPSFVGRADVDLFVGFLDGVPVGTSVAVSPCRRGRQCADSGGGPRVRRRNRVDLGCRAGWRGPRPRHRGAAGDTDGAARLPGHGVPNRRGVPRVRMKDRPAARALACAP